MDEIQYLKSEIELQNGRVEQLRSLVDDLYSRPLIDFTIGKSVGDILYFDIVVPDRVAPGRPRWDLAISPTLSPPPTPSSTPTITSTGTPGPVLLLIYVSPATDTVIGGDGTAFTATAVYSDLSEVDVTDDASWSAIPGTYASVSSGSVTTVVVTEDQVETIRALYAGEEDTATLNITPQTPTPTPTPTPTQTPTQTPTPTPTSTIN